MTAQGWRKRKKVDGGKGDAPRDNANQEAYNAGWDRIFGKHKKETQEDIASLEKRLKEQALER